MANPQRENGHIDVSNEIADAFARNRLSGQEWQVLWVIIRKTWGFCKLKNGKPYKSENGMWVKKKMDKISMGQITKFTGINRPCVCRTLKKLLSKGVIKKDNSYPVSYGIEKNYDKWKVLSKKITVSRSVIKKDNSGVTQKDNSGVIKKDNIQKKVFKETITKETKKDLKKEKILYIEYVYLLETEYEKLVSKLGDNITREYIERLNNYIGQIGVKVATKKYKSHYHVILNWLNKDKGGEVGTGSITPTPKVYICKFCGHKTTKLFSIDGKDGYCDKCYENKKKQLASYRSSKEGQESMKEILGKNNIKQLTGGGK